MPNVRQVEGVNSRLSKGLSEMNQESFEDSQDEKRMIGGRCATESGTATGRHPLKVTYSVDRADQQQCVSTEHQIVHASLLRVNDEVEIRAGTCRYEWQPLSTLTASGSRPSKVQ